MIPVLLLLLLSAAEPAAEPLVADAGEPTIAPGDRQRTIAQSAVTAARNAVETAPASKNREQANERLNEAAARLAEGRYAEAASAADAAWQLVSGGSRTSTQFMVQVDDQGRTAVASKTGTAVRVEAQGVSQVVAAGQALKVEKGLPPPPPHPILVAPELVGPDGEARAQQKPGQPPPLVLKWKSVAGAKSYEVVLEGPKSVHLTVPKAPAKLPALPAGRYQWTVWALAEDDRSPASETRAFELVDETLKLEVGKTKWK